MPPSVEIVACVDMRDRSALRASVRFARCISFSASARDVLRLVDRLRPKAAIVSVSDETLADLLGIALGLELRAVPYLLRLDLSAPDVRALVSVSPFLRSPSLSLREFDDLEHSIGHLLTQHLPESARTSIATRVLGRLPLNVADVVLGAAAVGERDVTVEYFALRCGLSIRTLEARLHAARILGPKQLLIWMLALHTSWRLSRRRISTKAAAFEAGMSPKALAAKVDRLLGITVRSLRGMPFPMILEQFSTALPCKDAPPPDTLTIGA